MLGELKRAFELNLFWLDSSARKTTVSSFRARSENADSVLSAVLSIS
jgi:hypothetical protein